jgi:hypothetical protein
MHSILRNRLAFLMPFCTSRIEWLVFVRFDWVLYSPGPIPAELGQLAKLERLELHYNQFTGAISPLLSLDLCRTESRRLALRMPYLSSRIGNLLFVWFDWVLYTPGPIPAELGQLANLKELYFQTNKLTGTPSLLSARMHSILRNRLAFLMPFRTSRIGWLVYCMFWLGFVYHRSHSGWIGPIGEIGTASVW